MVGCSSIVAARLRQMYKGISSHMSDVIYTKYARIFLSIFTSDGRSCVVQWRSSSAPKAGSYRA